MAKRIELEKSFQPLLAIAHYPLKHSLLGSKMILEEIITHSKEQFAEILTKSTSQGEYSQDLQPHF
jgi:hypothetical protein